jgi:phosphoserine aminotransferase
MEKIYFTPGPAGLYPTTFKHFQKGFQTGIASLSHRSSEFREMFEELTTDLKKFLRVPDDYYVFFTGSGTEAIERTIQNCVEKYSMHFVNGAFSNRFYQSAVELGKKPTLIEAPKGVGFDLQNFSIPQDIELVCFTHNESSTGVMTPVDEIELLAKKYPEKLFALDIVSSAPYGNVHYPLFDVVFFSVQKGFGLPAGMGVMIVSPRAIKKSEELVKKGISIGSYHGFPTLVKSADRHETPETPPVLHMYVLGKVLKDMAKIGIEKIAQDTDQKAKLLYEFLDTNNKFSAFVTDPKFRSPTIIVVDIQKIKGDIKKNLLEKGFIVGSGYGTNKTTQIRISNFPTHTIQDFGRLIKQLKEC